MEFERLQPEWKIRKAKIEAEFDTNSQVLQERLSLELRSTDTNLAAEAAEAVGWMRLDAEIPQLILLLGHPDEWLRDRASFALSRMPRMAIPSLAKQAIEFEGVAFEHAVKAFVRMKLAAISTLLDLLQHSTQNGKQLAHKALCQIKFPLEALSPALSVADHDVKMLAIDILGKSRDTAAISLLSNFRCDFAGSKHKVQVAMAQLARHFPEEIIAESSKPMAFLHLQALAKSRHEYAWEALQFLADSAARSANLSANIRLLRNFNHKNILPILENLAQSVQVENLRAILEVMTHNRQADFAPLLQQLQNAIDPDIAKSAAHVLSKYHQSLPKGLQTDKNL